MPHVKSFALVGVVAIATLASVPSNAAPKEEAKGFEAVSGVFKAKCMGCHSGPKPAGRFDVSSYAKVMAKSKGGQMIVAGKPEKSALMDYLKGTNKRPLMPMGGKKLPDAQLKLISDWIKAGAKQK